MIYPQTFEVSTLASDEANQGLTTDPFLPNVNQTSLGLRIPPVLPDYTDPSGQPRYVFLLATAPITQDWIIIRGIRQLLLLGANISPGTEESPTSIAEEFVVSSPNFRFTDGNVSWHLVREVNERQVETIPLTDTQSWAYEEADGPAMLYESFTNSNLTGQGQPVQYDVGLTAYTPPRMRIQAWQHIAGLGNFKDIRFPWQAPTNASAVNALVEGNCRISLYATVLQTNPDTRPSGNYPSVADLYPSGLSPESAFILNFPQATYWRIAGSILFEHVEQTVSRL